MDTITIFLKIVIQNINYIVPVLAFIVLVTFVGINIILAIMKEDHWSLILPLGTSIGLFGFIVFLGTFSYVFKARTGILVILLIFLAFGLILFRKNRKNIPRIKLSLFVIKALPIYFIISGLVVFLAGTTQYGGDAIAYWGFATSFANGNYPLRSPWQPDLLANHHQGTYLFEGAIYALTNSRMLLIHTLYSSYVILTGIFLIWAIVRKISKIDLLSIIPALTVYFSFGALFIPLPEIFRKFISPVVEQVSDRLPILLDVKYRLGGAPNLPELIYINHRAAALLGFLLIITLIYSKLKLSDSFKPALVAVLSVAVISSDEIFLPGIAVVVVFWFIKELLSNKFHRGTTVRQFFVAFLIFILFFFLVGNALRDSLLTPPQGEMRFGLILNFQNILMRSHDLGSAVLKISTQNSYFWLLPNLIIITVIAFIFAFISGNYWISLLLVSILGSYFAFFTVQHSYYPGNYERFLHQIYQHVGLILSTSFILLLKNKRTVIRRISYFFVVILSIPSIVFSGVYIYKYAKKPDYPNLNGKLPTQNVLLWARNNIPRERIFFVDGYIWKDISSYMTLYAIQDYGLLVPVSPAKIKVHTPDIGIEAVDVINTLNPSAMKSLKIRYLFIARDQLDNYPQERKEDVLNQDYFKVSFADESGTLFEVNESYYQKGKDLPGAISDLKNILKKNSDIYFDSHPNINYNLRAVIVLALKDDNRVYANWGPGLFNYIETKINLEELKKKFDYDYMVLGLGTDPLTTCGCKNVDMVWKNNYARIYQIKK